MSCGGHVSDYPRGGGTATGGDVITRLYGRRHFRPHGQTLGGGKIYGIPDSFQYNDSAFWSGYRGKRCVYPLPSDGWYEHVDVKTDQAFLSDYGMPWRLRYTCGNPWDLITGVPVFTKILRMRFNSHEYTYIMVRDYSINKNQHEYENFSVSLGASSPYEHTIIDIYEDHILHTFCFQNILDPYARSSKLFSCCGLKKLLIKVKENGDWVAKFTKSIVIPPWSGCLDDSTDTIDKKRSVCITVDYCG